MRILIAFLVLLPIVVLGQCIMEVVDWSYVPPDAVAGDTVIKYLWVTNIGDQTCDTSIFHLALAGWGLWLMWDDAFTVDVPFISPGDTVLFAFTEIRDCNEQFHLASAEDVPFFVDHYNYVEAPADSGVCDTFYIGNPTSVTITVAVNIDSVVGSDWDVTVFPIAFTLAPGDSQAISICSGFSGYDYTDTLWGDSSGIGGGARTFASATAEDSSRTPIDMGDAQLRQGRYRHYTNFSPWLPYSYEDFVSITQEGDISGAEYYDVYKNYIIRMNNSSPFEYNFDLSFLWSPIVFENTSFSAVEPSNPYTVNLCGQVQLKHVSFTDAAGNETTAEAAVYVSGADTLKASHLLIQRTHNTPALSLRSPFDIQGLVIKDALEAIKIYSPGTITDFQFENITGTPVFASGNFDAAFIASQLTPDDITVLGSAIVSLYSRARILVEDSVGNPIPGVSFETYWSDDVDFSGLTNTFGAHKPFPIKWAEIKTTYPTENRNIRIVLTHPDYFTLDTVVSITGIEDWFRFNLHLSSGVVEKFPQTFKIAVTPNPFNAICKISVTGVSTDAIFGIYDVLGQKITEFKVHRNDNEITWNTNGLPSGEYFYRLSLSDKKVSGKLTLLK